MNYLWDTNIAIYYLQQQLSEKAEKFVDGLIKTNQPVISAITEIELLCWKAASENDIKVMHNFISDTVVIELDQTIKMKTADIRKTHKIKLADAIIAATAIVNDLTLLTRNVSDFNSIADIKIINPWDM